MNYGYAETKGDPIFLKEHAKDPWVCSMQLYNHAIVRFGGMSDMKNKTMAEVGSGRGGGISHLTTVLKPTKAYGIDLSPKNVEFCQERYKAIPAMEFVEGDSTKLEEVALIK